MRGKTHKGIGLASFRLVPVGPFRLDLTAWTLRRQPSNVLDRWDGTSYRRVVSTTDSTFELAVTSSTSFDAQSLDVVARGSGPESDILIAARSAVERLLGTRVDLSAFYRFAEGIQELKPLVERFRGVKPPRFLSGFETLANGFFFQQISLAAGMSLMNHFVQAYGRPAPGSEGHAFPLPEDVAGVSETDLRALGLSRQKARALIELAWEIKGGLNLNQLEGISDEEALASLQRLRGVGRWTAHYFLLRGLGRPNAFPGDDVGARNRVMSLFGLKEPPDYDRMQDIIAGWQPYAGMVYFHLLLLRLAEKGHIK